MRRSFHRALALALIIGGCLANGPSALGSDLSEFLHAVFNDQYQRQPSGPELNYHAQLSRNYGPIENYIAICSSDEFFVNQAQRNLEVYVSRLYQVFLGRSPRPDELRYWVTQFQDPRIRREDLVRQFCAANRVTQLPSFPTDDPQYLPPATAPEIATELVRQVQLFADLVQREIGYSGYGRRVIRQAQQLAAVADQYRQVVSSGNVTGQQARIAADNVERSLQDLERDFYRVSGASSHSQRVLQQISQLVTAARSAPLGRPSQPINRPPVPSWPGYSDVAGLRDAIRQFAYGLQRYQHLGPEYANLDRDVQGLLVQIESLDLMIRQGQSRSRVRDAMQGVLRQSDHISSDVRRVDLRTQRGWWDLQVQIEKAARTLGIRGRNEVVPSDPVIINRPAWSGLPYQPPGRVPSRRNEEAVQLADELASKLDEYANSLRSMRGKPANVNRLIGSLQDLKHSALIFRQVAASGASGNRLTQAADAFMDQYQRTAADYTRVVADDSTLNSPVFYQVGELSQKLRYAARGMRA